MGRAAIDQLLYSLDRAFEGEESRWHGLVRNLTSLEPERWDDVPAGCVRSALAIVEHVGGALRVYDSQAFGDGSVQFLSVNLDIGTYCNLHDRRDGEVLGNWGQ